MSSMVYAAGSPQKLPLICTALALLAIACSGDSAAMARSEEAGLPPGGGEDVAIPPVPPYEVATFAPTFSAIHQEIFIPQCAAVFCHHSEELFFNVISREEAYATLVNAVTKSPDCGPTGLLRVVPGKPDESLLYLKLTKPPCGRKMPLSFTPFEPRHIEQIRLWIERGALEYEAGEPRPG